MEVLIFRPSVASQYDKDMLEGFFRNASLVDKTVCDERIVYIFKLK